MEVNYTGYLKIQGLLEQQKPLSEPEEHDEMLFIIIHQVYELWFKQILHEVDYLKVLMEKKDLPRSAHTFKRILTILKVIVQQLDVLETMTPLEFLSFRKFLDSASGFQSYQFRELEFVLGAKSEKHRERFPEGSVGHEEVERRYREPSLWYCFLELLKQNDYAVPKELLEKDHILPTEASPEIQEILIDIYRNNPDISQICELLVDFDEGVQEWRYRHVKMVQRTIGTKMGTGKSPGAAYLQSTLFKPVFPDLWEIRARL